MIMCCNVHTGSLSEEASDSRTSLNLSVRVSL